MSKPSLDKLMIAINDAQFLLQNAKVEIDGESDEIDQADLDDCRSELANASNAIDDAMGEIDKLLAPPRTREEMYDA